MRNSINRLLVFVAISVFLPGLLYGIVEHGRIVNPSNIQSLKFEIKITSANHASDCYTIELTGIENEVADIGSGAYIFNSDDFKMSEKPVPFYNPKMLYPNGETIERKFIEGPKEGRRKWMVEFTVNKSQIERTYIAILPPLNLSDGTTFIFDLPRFFSKSDKN